MVAVGSTDAWSNVWGPLIAVTGVGTIFCAGFYIFIEKAMTNERNTYGGGINTNSRHKLEKNIKNRTRTRTMRRIK